MSNLLGGEMGKKTAIADLVYTRLSHLCILLTVNYVINVVNESYK